MTLRVSAHSTRPWCRLICLLLLAMTMQESFAQSPTNYALHANIIYRFTKYIDWPENKKSGDFIIGVIGNTKMYEEIKGFIVNKTAGSQKILVKRFTSSEDMFQCHILFIGDTESRSLKKIAAGTTGKPILIVSEAEGLAKKGACINFIISDDHLKLEINPRRIEERGLNIASELLELGIIIK